MDPARDEYRTTRYVGVGCVTLVAGFFSGGMIGVFVAKMVGSFRGCQPPPELPACDWHVYAGVGMLIGVLTLPALALSRLRRGEKAAGKPD
jgi:MFS family permease